jgi:hypothetical protein
MEINQPKTVKPKTRGYKLRSVVNLLGELKQKSVKQLGIKLGLGVSPTTIIPHRLILGKRISSNLDHTIISLPATQSQG